MQNGVRIFESNFGAKISASFDVRTAFSCQNLDSLVNLLSKTLYLHIENVFCFWASRPVEKCNIFVYKTLDGKGLRGILSLPQQSEKFLDLGTVTRPPSNIYARVNCSVIRDRCTRVQGHPWNLFQRPWIFGLSSLKHHTWPYHASVLWYTEANFSFQMQQRKFPRPYLRNDTMDFHF